MIKSEATSAAPAEGEPTMKTGLWLLSSSNSTIPPKHEGGGIAEQSHSKSFEIGLWTQTWTLGPGLGL